MTAGKASLGTVGLDGWDPLAEQHIGALTLTGHAGALHSELQHVLRENGQCYQAYTTGQYFLGRVKHPQCWWVCAACPLRAVVPAQLCRAPGGVTM